MREVPPVLYVAALTLVWAVGLAALFRRAAGRPAGGAEMLLFGALAAGLCFAPVGGVPLWVRAFSFHPNPSLPFLGVVAVAGIRLATGRSWFRPEDWRATWTFGALAGTFLYLHPLAAAQVDVYFWGWERAAAAAVLGGLGALAFLRGLRAGLLPVAALAAFGVDALESRNAWDYVVDPFFWLLSLGMLATAGVRALSARRRPAPPPVS